MNVDWTKLRRALASVEKPIWRRRPEVLLHPNIPKPLHGMAPRQILGQAWWNQTRQAAYRSTDFHCIACGVRKYDTKEGYLEGHELYKIDYAKGKMIYLETFPVCPTCHAYIHDGRLQMLLDEEKISEEEYNRIMEHGEKVLREAGIHEELPVPRKIAVWSKWRLVIDGKEYPGKFRSYQEWEKHFHKE